MYVSMVSLYPQVDERLDADKGADVAEGGGEGGAEGAELEGEDLADEQPRDGVEAEAEGRHEEDDASQRDPVQRGRRESDLKLRLLDGFKRILATITKVNFRNKQTISHKGQYLIRT